jgi:hypothetical protein
MKTWIIDTLLLIATGVILGRCPLPASGDEPLMPTPDVVSSEIILPLGPIDLTPPVDPVGPVVPKPVNTISGDQWYVVQSSVPLITLQSPTGGLLDIEQAEGPIRVRGHFCDGDGKVETRTYKSAYVYFATAAKAGSVELILIPVGVQNEAGIVRQMLTVSVLPNPPPGPGPDPGPTPQPGAGKRMLIVYESSDLSKLPPAQAVLITSGTVRDYLNRVCDKGPDGRTPEFRIWDKDTDLSNVPQTWKDAMALPRTNLPWLIVSNGTSGYSGPLPADAASAMAKLKQYLGE